MLDPSILHSLRAPQQQAWTIGDLMQMLMASSGQSSQRSAMFSPGQSSGAQAIGQYMLQGQAQQPNTALAGLRRFSGSASHIPNPEGTGVDIPNGYGGWVRVDENTIYHPELSYKFQKDGNGIWWNAGGGPMGKGNRGESVTSTFTPMMEGK